MTYGVVTLLYDPSYLPGALVLGVALLKLAVLSSLDIEMAVLIDESKFTEYQKSLLLQLYDTLIPVDTLTSTLRDRLENDLGRPELAQTFTKVALWGLSRYEKVLYLDADTLPEHNTEHSVLDLLKLSFPHNKILAVPDSGFPDIFNSGVFVLQPNLTDYQKLKELVVQLQNDPDVTFDGADQGLLNQYFNPQPNWVKDLLEHTTPVTTDVVNGPEAQSSNWIKLPFLYNVTPSAQYQYLPAYNYFNKTVPNSGGVGDVGAVPFLNHYSQGNPDAIHSSTQTLDKYYNAASSYFKNGTQIKLIHFIGPVKPWHTEGDDIHEHHVHRKWWNLWSEYYGQALSIDTVAFWEKVIGNKLRDLKVTSKNKVTEPEEEVVPIETHNESHHSSSDPHSLCDPNTYNEIPSNVTSNPDREWDATREPPPINRNTDSEESLTFSADIGHYDNKWDIDEPEAEIKNHEHHHHHHHHHHHPLPAEEVLKTIEEEEEETDEAIDPPAEREPDLGYEKIFPWEFRERVAPERVFDY